MLNDTVLMSKIVKDNQTLSYTIHERSIVFRMEGGTGQVPFGVVELGGGLLEWKVAPHLPTVAIRSASMGLQGHRNTGDRRHTMSEEQYDSWLNAVEEAEILASERGDE